MKEYNKKGERKKYIYEKRLVEKMKGGYVNSNWQGDKSLKGNINSRRDEKVLQY